MSYAYADRLVWLEDLAPKRHPMVHDLCSLHADTVRVPRGWELRDTRERHGNQVTAAGSQELGADGAGAAMGQGALRLVGA